MGACYSVEVTLKSDDEEKLIDETYRFMNSVENAIFSHVPERKDATLDKMVDISLTPEAERIAENTYFADFDASYGWGAVIVGWFHHLAPYLKNSSRLWIDVDCHSKTYRVNNGKVA